MRVSFSCDLKPNSGKQNFAVRLSRAFNKIGVKVTDSNPDVNLIFISGKIKKCINIIRLDNAWINIKGNSSSKNAKIAKTMRHCHAVIYQSIYSKKVCSKFIGTLKKNIVIYNGCDPDLFKNPFEWKRPYILTFSRWRPHKRLKQTVEGFLKSGLNKEYDLLVCGRDPDYIINDQSVIYMGHKNVDEMQSIIGGAKFVIHLAFMDCCPNSVVESLVAGKNVLCSDSGGTKELVNNSGFCIKDKEFNYNFIDLYNPPELSYDDIIKGCIELFSKNGSPREDLFIDNIAKQYMGFFKKLL